MKIRRIFGNRKDGRLWAVCYPGDVKGEKNIDIFQKLITLWNDTQYLTHFFLGHNNELSTSFWGYMSIDNAVDKVLDEIGDLENELYSIENKLQGFENIALSDIFKPLHTNIYSLNFSNERFRKAKPNFNKPMLRIYAIELEDQSLVITSGAIKLLKDMKGDIFEDEKYKLNKVRDFLKSEGISDAEGLKQ